MNRPMGRGGPGTGAPARIARVADAAGVEKRILACGTPLVGRTDVENDIVALKLHVCMGSREETDREAGLSSLVGRLLLKGSERRSAARIAEDIESLGARLATTSTKEAASISLLCAREVIEPCFDLFMEVATRPAFPDPELEIERQAALARIRARKDQLLGQAFDRFHELFYGQHPFHKPAVGYESSVKSFTSDDVRSFYKRAMTASSLTASVVGRVDLEYLASRLETGLGQLPTGGRPAATQEPEPAHGTESIERRDVQTAKIVVGYPAPPLGNPDAPPMSLFAAILGGSMDSRLFTELREKRSMAYEIGSIYTGYVGPAFVAAYMGTRGEQADEARTALIGEVERLRDEGPTTEELDRARNFICGTRLMALERNANRAATYGVNELLGLGYDYGDRFLNALDQVTTESVRATAARWLTRPSVAAVLPTSRGTQAGE